MQLALREGVAPGPGPLVHPENEGFWNAVKEGTFRLQKCSACGTVRFPVAPCCWKCLSTDHSWEEIDGNGTVAAAIRIERATGNQEWQQAVPYITGMIDIGDGLRVPGRILCKCGKGAIHGERVEMVRIGCLDGSFTYAFEHTCE